ncbi:hydroxyisourate hydrolase [Halothiobacillus neapolitanus]|uniref:5-hydroxyisourate hydrolase n=1 Tax=Halothiobacillus neapolitanus (strain ATCC 23641 / DSM 15147 / CIP 104769 / NCIMB 8539 / c2) TaxID=555778 RepID=D0KZ33_HALNC|nr:hydroxyisourate hydrolase [Halothiobacillus neapolitanus]ACX95706.1 hydroxyisourate hydrolase [Halothiobacillus neapolitanus c2]TDN66012.1 5-hydroxyisourate hydrolase [Halothiobacillus neapolitanus]
MSALTTHILDTSLGKPAADVRLLLHKWVDNQPQYLSTHITNADGRCDAPILSGEAFTTGVYELVFDMGNYLRQHYADLPDPLFLDQIVIRFGISSTQDHYHVPLLVSPFGYSTYRGS